MARGRGYPHVRSLSQITAVQTAMDNNEGIPTFASISDFSQGSDENLRRYESLVQHFINAYGSSPTLLLRAPGRVNIIGEHVDYSGYGVLPMAVEQDIAAACLCSGDNSKTVTLSNTSPKYVTYSFESESPVIEGNQWSSYFLCGYKGACEELSIRHPLGLQVLVDGNLLPCSGLSSSSALVCCAAMTTIAANGCTFPSKKDMAEQCARTERFIGTQGGGMDQAISFLAKSGQALKIDFNPIRCEVVTLPPGYVFVVANSRVSANKTDFSHFNVRVVECRLAAKVLAKRKGLDWHLIKQLVDVQEALGYELRDMPKLVKDVLKSEPYTNEEVCQALCVPSGRLVEDVLPEITELARKAAKNQAVFKLHARASHVYQEAYRVIQFQDAIRNTSRPPAEVATSLGQLMNDSHTSCAELYECSCPELNRLVKVCIANGSLGSRLTGAGWGGCVVSLVPEKIVDSFLHGVTQQFYGGDAGIDLFATKPGPGAAICRL